MHDYAPNTHTHTERHFSGPQPLEARALHAKIRLTKFYAAPNFYKGSSSFDMRGLGRTASRRRSSEYLVMDLPPLGAHADTKNKIPLWIIDARHVLSKFSVDCERDISVLKKKAFVVVFFLREFHNKFWRVQWNSVLEFIWKYADSAVLNRIS